MYDHWTAKHRRGLSTLMSLSEAAKFAIAILEELSGDHPEIVQICGPMTTGGLGNLKANMDRFGLAIERARSNGHMVFDQMPFQDVIIRLTDHHSGGAYRMEILTDFYQPVFESGYVDTLMFLPGWEQSIGATKEREFGRRFNIAMVEYPEDWLIDAR